MANVYCKSRKSFHNQDWIYKNSSVYFCRKTIMLLHRKCKHSMQPWLKRLIGLAVFC